MSISLSQEMIDLSNMFLCKLVSLEKKSFTYDEIRDHFHAAMCALALDYVEEKERKANNG
jgi:hypothetical protein